MENKNLDDEEQAFLPSPFRYEEKSKFRIVMLDDPGLSRDVVRMMKLAAEDYLFDCDPESMDFASGKSYTEEETKLYGTENEWAFQVRFFLDHPVMLRMAKQLSLFFESVQQGVGNEEAGDDHKMAAASENEATDTFIKVESKKTKRAKRKKAKKELTKEGNLTTVQPSCNSEVQARKTKVEFSGDGQRIVSISGKSHQSLAGLHNAVHELQQRVCLLENKRQTTNSSLKDDRNNQGKIHWDIENQKRKQRQNNLILYKLKEAKPLRESVLRTLNHTFTPILKRQLTVWDVQVKNLSNHSVLLIFKDKVIRDLIWRNRFAIGSEKGIIVGNDLTSHQRANVKRIKEEIATLNEEAPKHQRIFMKLVGCSLFVNNKRMASWEQGVKEFLESQ